jgi:L-fuconolactonase
MASLKRDFLPEDLRPLLSAAGFDGSVAVQARQSLEETRWLLELAGDSPIVKGVVGWVDLCSPDLLEQLEQVSAHPKLVGLRHIVQAEPDDEFMLRPAFRHGIKVLGEQGLTYDLLVYPRQLPAAVQLVNEFPEQRFVLDHIAKPSIADRELQPWEERIQQLAKAENVWCKLSGMVTEARWKQWTADDFKPYLDVVFDAFGSKRLMIGSDWPVCTVSAGYPETLGLIQDYIRQLEGSEQESILGTNCAGFYGLK